MTTKTIPQYLEEERQKRGDAEQRIKEEAARIQPLHHGHHRTAKGLKLESPSRIKAVAKPKKAAVAARKKVIVAGKKAIRARKKVSS
jgi:hypothetical protein